jgi:predicted nucleotidyltransferase
MDTNKLKFTQLENEIFSLLCLRAGEKLSQREIAKILDVSPTAVAKSLKKLFENEFAVLEKTKTINFVSLNMNKKQVIEIKRVENLKNIYLSGLSDHLEESLAGSTIILFGSYSRGEDTNRSDIDIAVIERKQKDINLGKYEKMLNRKIIINFYDSWKDINKNLKNNILKGIVLHGGIDL